MEFCAVLEFDIAVLQKRLEKENVMIHFDDAWIPTDREKVEYADIGHF